MPSTSVPPPAIEAVPRQAARDPDFWLLAVATLAIFAAGIQLLVFPFGRSIASHALLGRAIVSGAAPVRDVWIAASPGIGAVHAAVQLTLGPSMMAFRTVETLALVSAVLAATRVCKQWFGLERVGVVAGALLVVTYVQLEIDHTGQPEFFAGVILMHALALCARETAPRTRWAAALLLGCLVGTLTCLVPAFTFAAALLPWMFVKRVGAPPLTTKQTVVQLSLIALGFVLSVGGFALWLSRSGAWPVVVRDYLVPLGRLWTQQTLLELVERAFHIGCSAAFRQSAIITAGLVATFSLGTLHEHERTASKRLVVLVVGLALTLALGFAEDSGSLAVVLPLTTLLAGAGIYKIWRRALQLGVSAQVVFWTAGALLFQMRTPVPYAHGTFLQRSRTRWLYLAGQTGYRSSAVLENELYSTPEYNLASSRRVANFLNTGSFSQHRVWVAGNEPQVTLLTHGLPYYRFAEPVPEHWEKAAPALARRAQQQSDLLQPEVIVVAAGSDESTYLNHGARAAMHFAPLQAIEGWRVYQRVHEPAFSKPNDDYCEPN